MYFLIVYRDKFKYEKNKHFECVKVRRKFEKKRLKLLTFVHFFRLNAIFTPLKMQIRMGYLDYK